MFPGAERRHRLEHLHLLVADRLAVDPDRRLHREVAQHLEQVVLDHVADRAGLVVERPSALHAEVLGHRDLHALDVVAVPDRLQERVGEAEEEHVVHLLLPEVVVDPEDRALRELRGENPVQLHGRREVGSERLLDDDARVLRAAGGAELLHDLAEEHGRDGEVVGRPLRAAQLLPDRRERGRVVVVAVDVAQERRELGEGGRSRARRASRGCPSPGPSAGRGSSPPWPRR